MNDFAESPTRLTGHEVQAFAKEHLIQRKVDDVNWRVLWENPQTGEFWMEHFPQSEMQGGGPPELLKISKQQATKKFGSW